MTGPDDVDELAALRTAAEQRRTVRRQIADAVVDHGQGATETVELRLALQAINDHWADLIRQAAATDHPLADIARAAGVAAPSLYYRLRQPALEDSTHRGQSPGGDLRVVGEPAPAIGVNLDGRALDHQGPPVQNTDRPAR